MASRRTEAEQRVEHEFRRSARESQARLSLRLSPEASALLEARIASGARRLVVKGRADDPNSVRAAKDRLVEALLRAGYGDDPGAERRADRESPGDGPRLVDEPDLRAVFDALCPGLWPFC